MSRSNISRRDFLKLTGYGLMGMILPGLSLNPPADPFDTLQGRVIDRILWSHEEPDRKSKRKKLYWHDLVFRITNSTISDDETAYNRVWYEVEEGGYVYSGSVQPVRTILNESQLISLKGALGEVSVPYTDAHLEADPNSEVVYRLYYETVHWVTASAVLSDGSIWYALLDDKFEQTYFAPGEHIRLIPDEELTPLSPDLSEADKRIEVRLDDQLVLAYEKNRLVFATRASTGGRLRSGTYTTPTGNYITYHKRPTRHMAAGDLASSGFDLPGVPWVIYIKENGTSFHGTYWHNDYGRPRSHGCINLTPQAAKWLFRWTIPTVPPGKHLVYGYMGTRVDVVE
ncbi:MAG: L,D-transpeptidase [Anaerolineales bacterium]|nr:L,D-transpeptidase [Anaerolineales bacterium]NUQ85556.1 L,D-transpeptidase [Anaerolineales bacterium]